MSKRITFATRAAHFLAAVLVILFGIALWYAAMSTPIDWASRNGRIELGLIAASILIEFAALVWMTPIFASRCWARLRGHAPDPSRVKHWWFNRATDWRLLLCGPVLTFICLFASWAEGNRLPGTNGWGLLQGLPMFCIPVLLVPVALGLGIQSRWWTGRFPGQSVLTIALLLLALPSMKLIDPIYDLGHDALERSIGISRLMDESLDHVKSCKEGYYTLAKPSYGPALRRLRPSHVNVNPHQLRIELHGGFDHFGYWLTKDEPNRQWVLSGSSRTRNSRDLLVRPFDEEDLQ